MVIVCLRLQECDIIKEVDINTFCQEGKECTKVCDG